ncbi:MAG: glycosyltransferase, partial [Pseudomonadota bacterium]|nr:glycosyltransferase [Pseudomonadota bacterium]
MQAVVMLVCNDFRDDARVQRQANTLLDQGLEVSVLAQRSNRAASPRERTESGLSVRRLSVPFNTQWRFVPFVKKILNSAVLIPKLFLCMCLHHRDHVIHAHDLDALLPAVLTSKIFKNKVIYDAHELITERATYRWLSPILGLLEAYCCKQVACVVTTTNSRAHFLAKKYGITPPKVVPNLPVHRDVMPSRKIEETLNILDNQPIAIYQGRLHEGRGIRTIINLAQRIPSLHFVLIGEGPQQSLVDEAALSSAHRNIYRIPWLPQHQLHEFTCSADIGLQLIRNTCANHYTTDSNKLFEYISAGLAVLASDFPEISATVEQYKVGKVCDPEDLDALTRTL